jgi:hypothetical protein
MLKPKSKQRPWSIMRSLAPPIASRSRDPFYHSARWKRESKAFREANPLCAECEKEGISFPGSITDHVIPKDICEDPWDWKNWQDLCNRHHAKKGAQDKKHFKK